MIGHIISGFLQAADSRGKELTIPSDTAYVWRRGLALQALEPVAICVPVSASEAVHAASRTFVFKGVGSEGMVQADDGTHSIHSYFLHPLAIARAQQEVQVTFKTPASGPARFVIVQDADFDY
jgi:hypothetical protein